MTPRWKELSGIVGFILLFGVVAYNLLIGTAIFSAIFRGTVAFLVYSILNIIITNMLVKLLSDYEFNRLKELSAKEEEEEMSPLELEQE
ncbi:hypothetical protein KQI63_02455 [bacterium]|nr:hypothetical protein [bacterium]